MKKYENEKYSCKGGEKEDTRNEIRETEVYIKREI
jgi:hypothetical protein